MKANGDGNHYCQGSYGTKMIAKEEGRSRSLYMLKTKNLEAEWEAYQPEYGIYPGFLGLI